MSRVKPLDAALMASPNETEQQFYEALQRGDIDKLMAVWSDDEEIICVHPGGPRIVGPMAIRAAFDAILANGGVLAYPEKIRRLHSHSIAVHSVLERIQTAHESELKSTWVVATNVYANTARGWRLIAHHASPSASQQVPEVSDAPSVLH